jgi:uncharacterized protein
MNDIHESNPTNPELKSGEHPTSEVQQVARPRRPRGFAAMDRQLVSEISRKGGKAAHAAGTAHEFTSDEARAAGRKGGLASHARRRKPTTEAKSASPGSTPTEHEKLAG